jgi:hypothetical protein
MSLAGSGSCGPLVVVTGWTAAGKSTLAEQFAVAGLARVAGSALLRPLLGDVVPDKAARLRSWLAGPVAGVPRDGRADRLADLALLRLVTARPGGRVVDSAGSLPLLLPPINDALLVRLVATPAVRAERVRRLLDGTVSVDEAAQIVRRKDATTAAACLTAWGLDLSNPVHQRRYDLILCCPDGDRCADAQRCKVAVASLADAAGRVYRCYLADDRDGAAAAVTALLAAVGTYRSWVAWMCPLLTSRADVSRQRWRDRLDERIDYPAPPAMGGSC